MGFRAKRGSLTGAAVVVLESDDVVLAEVVAHLHLDELDVAAERRPRQQEGMHRPADRERAAGVEGC